MVVVGMWRQGPSGPSEGQLLSLEVQVWGSKGRVAMDTVHKCICSIVFCRGQRFRWTDCRMMGVNKTY